VSQCGDIHPDIELPIRSRLRFSADPAVVISFTRECEIFSAPNCAGTSLATSVVTVLAGDTGGVWLPFDGMVTSPTGAASAQCSFRISNPTGADFTAWFDQLYLDNGSHIFSDGFESGDTSAWSAVQGE